jgi:environmental stress-induced protein Ves
MRPTFTLLGPADFKRTPWKNGLGWTDQIAISPETADLRRGDFNWRVSTARVAQSADFSPFPEHDRVLVVLEGAGVRLSHRFDEGEEPEVVDLPPGEPYEFPGDIPTRCDLQDGPIQDFSVFLRKGVVSAVVEPVELEDGDAQDWEPQGRTCFVFVTHGRIDAQGTGIGAGQILRIEFPADQAPAPLPLRGEGGARALLVQIQH